MHLSLNIEITVGLGLNAQLKNLRIANFVVSQLKETHCLPMRMDIHARAGWDALLKHAFTL